MRKEELWVIEDKPREKLMRAASSLTDVEVIAVLLGTGSAKSNVLATAKKLLQIAENNLARLAGLSIKDIMDIEGVGDVKALRLKAAIEFARRAQLTAAPKDLKMQTSKDAFRIFAVNLGDLPYEEFWVAFLNRRSTLISKDRLSLGGLSSTIVDPRILFNWAVTAKASSFIIAHNHPSGNLNPSQADIDLTKKLAAAGKLLDIQLVDHLIISGNNYCSFADSGLL